MLDSAGLTGDVPHLVTAEFGQSQEGFRALGDWASDLWAPSFVGDYSDFRTSLRCLNLGTGLLIEWQSAPIQLYRSPAHVAHGNLDFYRIVLNLAGDHHTTFGSRENVPLLAGDIGIFDEGVSDHTIMGETEPGGMVHCIVLMVPRARMAPLLRRPDSVHASVILGNTPFGRFVSGHFLSVWRHAPLFAVAEREAAVQSLVTLAAGGVGRAVAARGRAGQQVDRHRRRRALVVGEVGPVAAIQRVRPGPAAQAVVPGAAGQPVDAGVAIQVVGEGRAGQVLDPLQGVALGIAAEAGAQRQVDRHPGRRPRIAGRVDAAAADHKVAAGAAAEHVVAVTTIETVRAGEDVVEVGAWPRCPGGRRRRRRRH
jgi:hypothetical protein